MPRKCPPGTICIENITLIFLIGVVIFGVFLYNRIQSNKIIVMQQPQPSNIQQQNNKSSFPESVFLDPHVMPVRDRRAYTKDMTDPRGIPINVRTQGVDAAFRQVGILTRNGNGETILPLMGRPLQTNRDKHQFYTMNDKNNMIKLPVSKNGKSCTGEYGCDDLYNGDTVYVEGYKDSFKVTVYENNALRYIPFV
tara:strand:+ start:973 stop:1557 length:585 start_codon:yes stop_codon:yes gene_type:complete